jgi:hypothetical protein
MELIFAVEVWRQISAYCLLLVEIVQQYLTTRITSSLLTPVIHSGSASLDITPVFRLDLRFALLPSEIPLLTRPRSSCWHGSPFFRCGSLKCRSNSLTLAPLCYRFQTPYFDEAINGEHVGVLGQDFPGNQGPDKKKHTGWHNRSATHPFQKTPISLSAQA